jgi:hypothetical protein
MPKVAILLAASPNKGFYSQISALNLACRKLPWGRWEWEICAAMGCRTADVDGEDEFARWRMHLRDVTFIYVSEEKWDRKYNWVQVEAQLSMAPRDADVYLALDADTLPVSSLEDVLDEVVATQSISGVMAHYPPPALADIESWQNLATQIGAPSPNLEFDYSLLTNDTPEHLRKAPLYFNGGVRFFPSANFERFVRIYSDLTWKIMETLPVKAEDFSSQIALPFALREAGLSARTLPMRYNYPNDDAATVTNPGELEVATIFHYLRTRFFDRQKIFASAADFEAFLSMPLIGANLAFRDSVHRLFGSDYPFSYQGDGGH